MDYEQFNYTLYKNQICIQVEKPKKIRETWASYNIDDMFLAMKTLSKSGFELYMYIVSNIDGYKFGIGAAPVCNATGMSAKSYQRATLELKEKGYLTYHNEFVKSTINGVTAPKWHFHSRPMVKSV